jgi:hypothetical protein
MNVAKTLPNGSFGTTHARATRMQHHRAAIIATLLFLPALLCAQTSQSDVNAKYVKQWSERIAGKENEPAEKVFKNLQYLKNTRAALLLTIMDVGYSRGLGVTCTHCHVETDFASDDKRPKRAAREMAAMHRMINQQLAKMENLKSDAQNRAINCSICHRGEAIPQG